VEQFIALESAYRDEATTQAMDAAFVGFTLVCVVRTGEIVDIGDLFDRAMTDAHFVPMSQEVRRDCMAHLHRAIEARRLLRGHDGGADVRRT
jgi:hypothetical protein